MRAILIDPVRREVTETDIPLTQDFMWTVSKTIAAAALSLDVVPGKSAMFLDAIGFLHEHVFCWRFDKSDNMAGAALIFGLGPDGKLTDAPAEMTLDAIRDRVLWSSDTIERTIERMEIVEYPGGLAPRVNRQIVWKRGAVIPANAAKIETPAEVDIYAPSPAGAGAAQAPSAASPATPVTAAAASQPPTAAPVAPMAPIWAIHETDDNRYRVIEYEVTAAGLGAPLSLATVPSLDAARARVPAGLVMRPADDDTADDTLVETWS